MFRNLVGRTLALGFRNASTAPRKERWDLCVGVLIERLPVVSKKLNEVELEFMVSSNQFLEQKSKIRIACISENNQSN